MKEFDWEKFKDGIRNIRVHCKTEEEANDFLKLCDKNGIKWSSGENTTEENILKIKKLLNIKNDNLLIEKNSSDFYLLKGFFLKLKEEGFNFPIKKEKEIVFDFEDKFDIKYLLKTAEYLLSKNEKDKEKDLIKEQSKIYGNDYKSIATILNLEEKAVELVLKRIENTKSVMRKANPKVKD